MLYFITTTFNESEWHVGDPIPDDLNIKEVQADGDELSLIRVMLPKIPRQGTSPTRPVSRVIRWFDFDAVNIYNGLKKLSQK